MAKGKPGSRERKRKEKRVVPHGVAHVQATFNNTIITISDPEGKVVTWSSAGRIGFKGSRKGTPFAAQVAGKNAGTQAKEFGMRSPRTRRWPGIGYPCDRCLRPRREVDSGRHADTSQWVPAAKKAPRLESEGEEIRWHAIQDLFAGSAGGSE
jgi:hypothetical protein